MKVSHVQTKKLRNLARVLAWHQNEMSDKLDAHNCGQIRFAIIDLLLDDGIEYGSYAVEKELEK